MGTIILRSQNEHRKSTNNPHKRNAIRLRHSSPLKNFSREPSTQVPRSPHPLKSEAEIRAIRAAAAAAINAINTITNTNTNTNTITNTNTGRSR